MSPRFIGPFEIPNRVGEVAYRLALPPSLEGVHDVFHVSQGNMFRMIVGLLELDIEQRLII